MEKSNADILPTPYRIRVQLGREIPQSKVRKQMFSIQEKDSRIPVPVASVRRVGAPDEIADPPLKAVLLDAELNPAREYSVNIAFPDGVSVSVPVAALEEPANRDAVPTLINFGSRFFKMEVNPFAADGTDGVGLNYDVRYEAKHWRPGSALLRIDLQTHGEVSLTDEDESEEAIQNSLKGGLNATLLYNIHAGIPLGDETRAYAYPMGFRISPAEFEANRGFTEVNYTAKAVVGGAIPYLDYLALLWSKWFKLDVPFFPPTLFTGFTALSNVKNDGSDSLSRFGKTRWDTEFLYFMPLHRRLDFKFSWKWYVGLEKGLSEDSYEAGAIVYMDEKRSHGFTLSHQEGALPPDFKRTRSWRVGYVAKF